MQVLNRTTLTCIRTDVKYNDVLTTMLGLTFSKIAHTLSDQLLFHAAVLERERKAFIFPGVAGSGKTTLAALLCKQGFGFLSDELAVIDPATGWILPLPLPMSIKKGAWTILSPVYPELDTQNSYVRFDGKEVKILAPELKSLLDSQQRIEPAALIFPRYDPSLPSETREMSKSEAMRHLVATCSSSRPLTQEDFGAMVQLVDNHPFFAAIYKNFDTVYALVENIRQNQPYHD